MRDKVKITGTQFTQSKARNRMINLLLATSAGETIHHYITFLPNKPDVTNRILDSFFKAFEIKSGNFDFSDWLGREAEAELVDEEWNGKMYKKVKYFVIPRFTPSPQVQKVLDDIKPEEQPATEPEEKSEPEQQTPEQPEEFFLEDFEKEFGDGTSFQ